MIKTHLPLILLAVYMIRMIVFGQVGLPDSLIVLALASLHGFKLHLDAKILPDPTVEMKADVDMLKNSLNTIKLASGFKPNDQRSNFKF